MAQNKTSLWTRLFDRHANEYHIAAVVFATVALGLALTSGISAEEGGSTATGTTSGSNQTTNTVTSCSYSYGDWSPCQTNGTHSRALTGMSPSGCVQTTAPKLTESCSYSPPQCSYNYSDWGACQSNGQQTRTILSTSPTPCQGGSSPSLTRSCTYTAPTTTSTSGSTATTTTIASTTQTAAPAQCVYTYTSWGACRSEGKRSRNVLSKGPSSCEEYTKPVVEQSCYFEQTTSAVSTTPTTVTTNTAAATSTGTSVPTSTVSGVTSTTTSSAASSQPTTDSVTPPFVFTNVSDGLTVRQNFEVRGMVEQAERVEFYLVSVGSNTHKYAGTAVRTGTSSWQFVLASQSFPNGEFYLRPKIKNAFGEYGGGQRKILIANGDRSLVPAATTNEGFEPVGMSDDEKRTIVRQFQEEVQIPPTAVTPTKADDVEGERRLVLQYCLNHAAQCQTEKDTDRDGLSNVDEIRFGSNPGVADTDLDGFIDGDEVKNGFDPVKYSGGDKSDKIVFESPKSAGDVRSDIYTVRTVTLESKEAGKERLRFSGTGLPNSFVTIYVYSDPIILTVKTDSEGNWSYELDKTVEEGEHEVYVAVTDNTGKITAKSEPLPFVKVAQAITVVPKADAASSAVVANVTERRTTRDIFMLIAISLAALAAGLAIIGLVRHRNHVGLPPVPPVV
ncbi:MAG: Ig-like domain-containing protein [Candidatus Moraniibacteriota bacterium]